MDIVFAEVDQQERPFPDFDTKNNLLLYFIFSHAAANELSKVKILQAYLNQDYAIGT